MFNCSTVQAHLSDAITDPCFESPESTERSFSFRCWDGANQQKSKQSFDLREHPKCIGWYTEPRNPKEDFRFRLFRIPCPEQKVSDIFGDFTDWHSFFSNSSCTFRRWGSMSYFVRIASSQSHFTIICSSRKYVPNPEVLLNRSVSCCSAVSISLKKIVR